MGRKFIPVVTPYKAPYAAIGMITGQVGTEDETIYGTGALIRGNAVLTCAHNFYHKHYNKDGELISQEKVRNLKFHPCPLGEMEKQKAVVGKPYYLDDYVQTEKDEHNKFDFAILELAEDLSEYGSFSIDSSPDNYEPGRETLILAGYPYEEKDRPKNIRMYEDKNVGSDPSP